MFGQNCANDVEPRRWERGSMEPGAWRIELSPKTPAQEDSFLTVLQVTDRQSPARWPVQRIESPGRVGCLIGGPDAAWVVLLRSDGRRSSEPVEFSVPGQSPCRLLVADLTPGRWQARQTGSQEVRDLEVGDAGTVT